MKHLCILALSALFPLLTSSQSLDWTAYGQEPGGKRYVASDQITPKNVSQLQVAWQFQTQELETYKGEGYLLERAAFEATPVMVDGVLYFPTPTNRVFAIDAQTGKEIWQFDPNMDLFRTEFSELTCRGVSYWENPQNGIMEGVAKRIVMGTVDGRLFSLDAVTGKPDPKFGKEGVVDLKLGTGLVQVTSAPAIYKDIIIVGSSIGDNNRTHAASGVVRAFSIHDGAERWAFDPIPQSPDLLIDGSWQEGSANRTGAANVWATISVDEENGLVYLPSSSPSPDFYGGERLGNNDYANSVIALDAETGEYRWHFQVVHHDLWDYDIPSQPVLFELEREGKKQPAVAIGTKMGHIFILNRLTGEPIFPFEERPVPASDVPGEVAAKTQPFPILPKPIGLQGITLEDAWGPNAEERQKSQELIQSLRYEGIFTPPSFEGTLVSPGNTGGINWGGMSYDPDRQILVTNINRFAYMVKLLPRHEPKVVSDYLNAVRSDDNMIDPETNRMIGTPYRMARYPFVKALESGGIFGHTQPPWGTILGIDLNTGEKLWEKPLGYMGDATQNPEVKKWGSINLGGTCLTAGGLTFVAATVDNHLRAFETETGKLLWEHPLPASGIATPMSYEVDGEQYIVIAAGGHGKNPFTKMGDYVIAFSL